MLTRDKGRGVALRKKGIVSDVKTVIGKKLKLDFAKKMDFAKKKKKKIHIPK